MASMRLSLRLGVVCLAATGLAVACGDSGNNGFSPSPNDGGVTTDAESDSPSFQPTDGGDASNCTQCSGDLHSILTCGSNPQVLQTCTGDLGCGPTGCIAACDAAAANKSSIGCDYYTIPSDSTVASGSCFAAFVTNTWSTPLKVTLLWKGKSIDATPFSYIPKGTGASITYQPVTSAGFRRTAWRSSS